MTMIKHNKLNKNVNLMSLINQFKRKLKLLATTTTVLNPDKHIINRAKQILKSF